MNENILSRTRSVCPVCLRSIGADRVMAEGDVYLEKECPEHGVFKTVIWRGAPDFCEWNRENELELPKTALTPAGKGCPYDCGVCPEHKQQTCCVLLEVTSRCDQRCPVCFADAGGEHSEPGLEEIKEWLKFLMETGEERPFNIQLSGGEPTMRDDLPDIIRAARQMGFPYVQLNTNGKRLSYDERYLDSLIEAGLSAVFLQFDGTRDGIYERLRGAKLFDTKKKAIENCARHGVGVVLVPTLVPGVNTDNIGEIVRFAIDNLPAVRGVHFQPVSYFGRFPAPPEDRDRITLPEVAREIERQTGGSIKAKDLKPLKSGCALCAFKGSFMLTEKGDIASISDGEGCCCGKDKPSVVKARDYLLKKWVLKQNGPPLQEDKSVSGLDKLLYRIRNYGFSITCMAFQDAWNLDLERLQRCSVHVFDGQKRRLVPFCAYNLTSSAGRALYRERRV